MNPLMGRKVKRAAWELQSNYLLSELHMKKLAQRLTFTHTDNNEVIIPLMFFQVHNLKTRFQYLPYSLERQNSWLQRNSTDNIHNNTTCKYGAFNLSHQIPSLWTDYERINKHLSILSIQGTNKAYKQIPGVNFWSCKTLVH